MVTIQKKEKEIEKFFLEKQFRMMIHLMIGKDYKERFMKNKFVSKNLQNLLKKKYQFLIKRPIKCKENQ